MSRSIQRAALHVSAEAAEAAFYEALQAGDVDALMQVWADDEDIVCIHPGGPRLVGAEAIRSGFEQLLAGGGLDISPDGVLRQAGMGSAVHNVVERVLVRADLEHVFGEHWAGREGDTATVCVVATNVYSKTPDGWRMVLHHASPGTEQEAAEVLSDRLH